MRVGFVGLGAMGMNMARNLSKAGLLAGVYNRTAPKAESLAQELKVKAYPNLSALGSDVDAVVSCVSADADVLEVAQGLKAALRRGTLLCDCSTISSDTARRAAQILSTSGIDFLDCPVSGGTEGARDATLAIMVGGSEEAFERALPLLKAMGKAVTLFGPVGSGQAAKATNQIMCAGIIQAVGEAMAFAHEEGVDLKKVIDVLGKGAGSSWYFVNRAPFMANNSFPAGFRVRLHDKDLRICRDMAAKHGGVLPVVESTLEQYEKLIAEGYGDEDISAIYRLKTQLFPPKPESM